MSFRKLSGCRFCEKELVVVLDLGNMPLANDFRAECGSALAVERFPLCLMRCSVCGLYQLSVAVSAERLFCDYAYDTPTMPSLTRHYEHVHRFLTFCSTAGHGHTVMEIGSNNGSFLRTCRAKTKIGIDPAKNIVERADIGECEQGLTIPAFFTEDLAERLVKDFGPADLVVARHCFAHIDDVAEIVRGVRRLLKPRGVFYIENAYVVDTLLGAQFDQIYHEHVSYLGLAPLAEFLTRHGMKMTAVDFSPVHGGSLMVAAMLDEAPAFDRWESRFALKNERAYLALGLEEKFVEKTRSTLDKLSSLLSGLAEDDSIIDLYGATAKSTTLLNALPPLPFRQCLERSPSKLGKFMPGTGIPIVPEAAWEESLPDYCLLTAWNYADEIIAREARFRAADKHFIVPLPEPRII